VAYRGGDSAGWRADSILMERLDKMTKKMSREEKRVTELVRQRMKESLSMEMLGFDVESVREGGRFSGWT